MAKMVGTALLVMCLASTGTAGTKHKKHRKKWAAKSVTPSLHKADRFLKSGCDRLACDGCIATLKNSGLLVKDHWVRLIPTRAIKNADGTITLDGFFMPRKQPKYSFVTDAEADVMKKWDEDRELQNTLYMNELNACARYHHGGCHYYHDHHYHCHCRADCENRATEAYDVEEQEAESKAREELDPINRNIVSRIDEFARVDVHGTIGVGLAKKINVGKLSTTHRAKVLFNAYDIRILSPHPETTAPCAVSTLMCDILDVNERFYKKPATTP